MKALFIHKPEIVAFIDEVYTSINTQYSCFAWDKELLEHTRQFVERGKMFRGCLLIAAYDRLDPSGKFHAQAVKLAGMVELYESGLLVQDDVIDQDQLRRGKPTFHTHIQTIAAKAKYVRPKDVGEHIAICYGDILFFIAQQVLAGVALPQETYRELCHEVATEMLLLGLAQAEDIRMAGSPNIPSQDEIIAMYQGKTGRYTGRWPISLATMLAGIPSHQQQAYTQVGEDIGVIYQLRDDYLGLYGESSQTGKHTTSDILQGKKTLYFLMAHQHLSSSDLTHFQYTYGNPKATPEDIRSLLDILQHQGIVESVDNVIKQYIDATTKRIMALEAPPDVEDFLLQLLALVGKRHT